TGVHVHVLADTLSFLYADQTNFAAANQNNNFDAEAICVVGDSIWLFSKNWINQQTKRYVMPKVPGHYSLWPRDSFDVEFLVTAADYWDNTKELMLLGYEKGTLASSIWRFNDFKIGHPLSGNKRKSSLAHDSIWQTDGLAFLHEKSIWLSSES